VRNEELLAAARAGQREAWDELVDANGRLVWSITRSMGLSSHDAADVFQTVFLRLSERLSDLREPDRLPGWLATTTRRACIELFRSKHKRSIPTDVTADQPDDAADPARDAERREIARLLTSGLRRLSEECRQLIRLTTLTGEFSYAEIAVLLEMPVGSIGPKRARCLERLGGTPEVAQLRPT